MLSTKEYNEYVKFEKDYDDLLKDFILQQTKVKPFSWMAAETVKPTFATWTGGSLGGVNVAAFNKEPLDDYFESIFGEKFLSRNGASGYEVDSTGLVVPTLAVSPFRIIPQMYYDKWNHLWHDILGSVYNPLNNVDRYEYTEYGKIFGGTNEITKQDATRQNVTVASGSDTMASSGSDSLVYSGSDSMASTGTDSIALTGTDSVASSGHDTTAASGTDTNVRTGSESNNDTLTFNGVKDQKSGSVQRTYNSLKDTTVSNNKDTTTVSAFNSSTYEPSQEVTHSTIGDGDSKTTTGGYTDGDTSANTRTGNQTDNRTVTYNSVSDALTHGLTDTTTYGKTDTTTYGKNESTTYGRTDTTSYGKTGTTNYGKSDTTTYGKSDTTTLSGGELHRVHGNIGVTKTTELLDAEIQFRIWRFYQMVMDDISKIMFLKTY